VTVVPGTVVTVPGSEIVVTTVVPGRVVPGRVTVVSGTVVVVPAVEVVVTVVPGGGLSE
jgi:hypothetical protein